MTSEQEAELVGVKEGGNKLKISSLLKWKLGRRKVGKGISRVGLTKKGRRSQRNSSASGGTGPWGKKRQAAGLKRKGRKIKVIERKR